MKRKQTRYRTEAEIIAAIDAALALRKELIGKVIAFESEAASHLEDLRKEALKAEDETVCWELRNKAKAMCHGLAMKAKIAREKANKINKRAAIIQDVKLKKLGRTLSAFRTQPMDCICGSDVGVVESK